MNRERLAATFTTLCAISSPSRKEGQICNYLQQLFAELGADLIYEDNSATHTESDCGNLIIRFNGNKPEGEGFFLACHMDTVGPCDNVKVVRTGDIFTSDGKTILGGDDKSGIAAIIEMIQTLQEENLQHPTIEIIITTCEEIGLLGAKHLEYEKLESRYGYALDSSGINQVVIGAPAANRFAIDINGRAAHAGLCPEKGINSLTVATRALSRVQLGRLDEESTSNIGLIQGGTATNIVPSQLTLKGEVRSHNPAKLATYTEKIFIAFQQTAQEFREELGEELPVISFALHDDYPALRLDPGSAVVSRVQKAGEKTGTPLSFIQGGGGSDANIFFGYGLPTAIISTGMDKVHTVEEQLDLADLTQLTELILALATTNN